MTDSTVGSVGAISPRSIKTGRHVGCAIAYIPKEELNLGPSVQRFHEKTVKKLNDIGNGTPDHDTGYMKVESSVAYTITHNLGVIPSRVVCFFCEVEEPVIEKDIIYPMSIAPYYNGSQWCGIQVYYKTKDTATLNITNSVYADLNNGYVRMMFWR